MTGVTGVSEGDLVNIAVLFLVLLSVLGGLFVFGFWMQGQRDSPCPYSTAPLRNAGQLSFYTKEQVLRFIYAHRSYDNKLFKLKHSAFSRETGRIFPNALTWYGVLRVDWDFIQKRRFGHYVSWGSLSQEQQEALQRLHGSALKGYQTTFSSPNPSPREVEPQFAFAKPGPLYVDIETQTLMGWKCVPNTDCEVLIVQSPPKLLVSESS